MNPKEFIESIWTEVKEDFNDFLKEKGLKKVTVVKALFNLEKKPLTLAIFPTATTGATYEESNGVAKMDVTFQMYCNKSATEEGVGEALEYYSAFVSWLRNTTFGKYSESVDSVLCRLDEGEPVNGFVLLLSATISDLADWGWD